MKATTATVTVASMLIAQERISQAHESVAHFVARESLEGDDLVSKIDAICSKWKEMQATATVCLLKRMSEAGEILFFCEDFERCRGLLLLLELNNNVEKHDPKEVKILRDWICPGCAWLRRRRSSRAKHVCHRECRRPCFEKVKLLCKVNYRSIEEWALNGLS